MKILLKNPLLGLLADSCSVSQPLASERRQLAFFRTTLVRAIFGHLLLLLEEKTKFIKICAKLCVSKANVFLSKCTRLLLRSNPLKGNCLFFYQSF